MAFSAPGQPAPWPQGSIRKILLTTLYLLPAIGYVAVSDVSFGLVPNSGYVSGWQRAAWTMLIFGAVGGIWRAVDTWWGAYAHFAVHAKGEH